MPSVLYFLLPSRGKLGEKKVSRILSHLPENEYRVINNLIIPNGLNKTSQIDHIVISEYGIFVIETKNYNGWIYGSENSEYWSQKIYRKEFKFYNPIFQNIGHINAIMKILQGYESSQFISIITFSRKAQLKSNFPDYVIYFDKILNFIRQYREKVISTNDVDGIFDKLMSAKLTSKEAKREHNNQVREVNSERQETINSGHCPRCGGNLVLRHGRYGDFYGCSNYPKCKFTLKIN